MPREVSPNKLSKSDKRRIEHVRERLRNQGVSEDEATKRAVDEVTTGGHSGRGGGKNSASDHHR